MENLENEQQEPQHSNSFDQSQSGFVPQKWEISNFAIEHLYQAAKWAGFLSIVGLVMIGLMTLVFIVLMFSLGSIAALGGFGNIGGGLSVLTLLPSLVILLIYAIPIWWLYNFSTNIKQAIATNDSFRIEAGLNFLRKHYKFIGILMAILLAFYLLIFVLGILGGLFAALI